ncbi:MAG: HAD-IIB family hydrolase [bacterium]
MIKALILDVDGVLVGAKEGFNFPDPHPEVIMALRRIRNNGTPISLCTAKPYFAIEKIINEANLDNIHISEGGAFIFNPKSKYVFRKYLIDTQIAIQVIQALLEQHIYTEFYDGETYLVQKDRLDQNIFSKHLEVLKREPRIVVSLAEEVFSSEITKIMPIVPNEGAKAKVEKVLLPFMFSISLQWSIHPSALPWQFAIITAKGVDKKQGALDISDGLGINLENILGCGDSPLDWGFIELCGYGGAMGNASLALKNKVLTKGKEKSCIGRDIDENGILDIFNYFQL